MPEDILSNYYNQSYHNKLKRKLSVDVITRLLSEIQGAEGIYQTERWHWNGEGKAPASLKKLVLGNDGRSPGTESALEIWNDILGDCSDDNEIALIEELREKSPEIISRPYYSTTVTIDGSGESFVANLIWDRKHVILFLNDSYDDYLIAKKTGWDVYCTREGIDVNEFLKKVGEQNG